MEHLCFLIFYISVRFAVIKYMLRTLLAKMSCIAGNVICKLLLDLIYRMFYTCVCVYVLKLVISFLEKL